MRSAACIALAVLTVIAAPATAQIAAPRAGLAKASKDPAASPAGTYQLDARQAAVILRVAHAGGFSYSVFRMNGVAGVMSWTPDRPEASKVRVTIDAKSLQTNVPGFADQLTGPDFLNAAKFPDATFVSTAIKLTGATTGEITGDFTLHGVTRPLTLAVELVGAGPSLRGPALGFSGRGVFHRSDFGVGPVSPVIGDDVELIIDVEFYKAS